MKRKRVKCLCCGYEWETTVKNPMCPKCRKQNCKRYTYIVPYEKWLEMEEEKRRKEREMERGPVIPLGELP